MNLSMYAGLMVFTLISKTLTVDSPFLTAGQTSDGSQLGHYKAACPIQSSSSMTML
jgi:hypothetical protein